MLDTKENVGHLLSSISEGINSTVKFLIASGEGFVVIGDQNYPVAWVYTAPVCSD